MPDDQAKRNHDEGAEAWRVPPLQYLREHPPAYAGARLSSCYVVVRDGTRLSVDVHLPGTEPEDRAYPTVVLFTPYYRRFALRPGHKQGIEACPNIAIFRDGFLPQGYAVVAVDVRGCGASFGSRDGFRSPRERDDSYDVVSWIVEQPWCDGNLGATGISYVGAAADFLASTGHPAVKAVAPTFSVWDTWSNHLYPGGVLLNCVTRKYGDLAYALDHDRRDALRKYPVYSDPDYAGPAPVDEDRDGGLLRQALIEHQANFDMQDFAQQFRYRDSALSDNPDYTSAKISPYHYAKRENDLRTATYGISGWMDGCGYANGAIQRHLWLENPQRRLLLGPWDHGARANASPWRRTALPGFGIVAETLRFFDEHLKGFDTGLAAEKPVHYFTMAEERWKAAETWPPPEAQFQELHFAEGGALVPAAPQGDQGTDEGVDHYQADFNCRTGSNSRYDRLYVTNVTTYYPDWHGRDDKMLCYTGAPLKADTEVTGHPVVTLHLACSERDCALFVYLEDLTPEGKSVYVTEGVFRALHRKIGSNPSTIPALGPSHSFNREDAVPLTPGEPAEIAFDLLPTSYLFREGHRIRVAIAAADSDHLSRIPDGRPPRLTFFRNKARASRIALPVVPRPDSETAS